ncbi:MAG: hypothetical protein L0Z62_48110 [Gemmataceae bacterium]|nr:hypothetical protein [Gemmataceae bacterium]
MNTCQTHQAQLLHHLYGLLDAPEQQTLTAHLETCADCRAALDSARTQQQAITYAAKGQFPGVRFEPPATLTPTLPPQGRGREEAPHAPGGRGAGGEGESSLPTVLPVRRWGRWAAAAAIVVAVVGLVGVVGARWAGHANEASQAQRESDRARQALDTHNRKQQQEHANSIANAREVQLKINDAEKKWIVAAQKVEKDYPGDLRVKVTGPRTVQAGAPNVYRIDARGAGQKTLLAARILDATSGRELARKDITEDTTHWVLPQSLPVQPGSRLTLVVSDQSKASHALARTVGLSAAPLGMPPLTAIANHLTQEEAATPVRESLDLIHSLYATHLTTDRPMYRPGEVVRFRSLTLDRFSLNPAEEDFLLTFRITDGRGSEVFKAQGAARVKGENGKEIVGPDGKPLRGIGVGEFRLSPEAPGGEYTLTVSEAFDRFPAERRKFLVNRYQAPRLAREVEFTRKTYGPGDVVEINCKVARVEGGGVIDNEPLTVSAHVDDQPCVVLDDGGLRILQGKATVKLRLPEQMKYGEGVVSIQFRDGGILETTVRPLPIVLKKLLVKFFPEGGDLVAGLPNRVYFSARTTLGKPAELRGRVVDQDGKEVATLQTLNDDEEAGVNQGLGVFSFTPRAGKHYEVKIDEPKGIEGPYPLFQDNKPQVKAEGVVLTIPQGAFTDRIDATVRSTRATTLLVGAYCRGRLLDHTRVEVKANEATPVRLTPIHAAGGVYRVTVFERRDSGQLKPMAERLVYRRPAEALNVEIKANRESYTPGERVTLTLRSRDEKNRSAPAVVLLSAVDLGVLKLADDKTLRSMPAHFLLTAEVRRPEDLEYADFLLTAHPKAEAALDLLLGTQGWRRFAEQEDPVQFRQRQPEESDRQQADRLVMASGRAGEDQKTLLDVRLGKVDQQFGPKYLELQKQLADQENQAEENAKKGREAMGQLEQRLAATQAMASAASTRLAEYRGEVLKWAGIGLAVLLVVLAVVGFVVGLSRMARNLPRAAPYFATGITSLALLMVGGMMTLALTLGSRAERGMDMLAAQADRQMPKAAFGGMPPPREMAPMMADKAFGNEKAMAKEDFPPKKAEAEKGPPVQVKPAPAPPPVPQVPGMPRDDAADPFVPVQRPRPPEDMPARKEAVDKAGPFDREERFGGDALAGEFLPGEPGAPGFLDRQLRKQGRFDEIVRRRLNLDMRRARALPTIIDPLAVRVYAHKHTPAADGLRRDFTETIYWHPVLVLPGAKATEVSFDLPDSVTRFQVVAWGHSLEGRLGATTTEIAARLPFSVHPTVPVEVTRSDKLTIPLNIANDTKQAHSVEIEAQTRNLDIVGKSNLTLAVDPEKRVRQLFQFRPSVIEGEATLRFLARTNSGGDRVEERFKIVPEGFPIVGSRSDLLEKVAAHEITLPEHWVKGTLKLQAEVFPSTLADLQKGLEAMLREPCGCFEQSSSSNYPNVMILSYLKETEQAVPAIEQQARAKLGRGYTQLTSFECKDPAQQATRRGYEWFGQTAPPHEALTAYGLLQFMDMKRVGHKVDEAMLERTKSYLLGQRDGRGGFKRNPRALDSFGRAPDQITNAYIVWALTEAKVPDNLDTELNALHEQAKGSKDPYFVSLVGLGLLNRGKSDEGLSLLRSIRTAQQADGRVTGATISITGSGGRDLDIETTALATLGWLRANRPADFNDNVKNAAKWIGQQRGGFGGFGSTQSTILALKALIAFTSENKKIAEADTLILYVNDKEVSRKDLPAGTRDGLVVSLPDESALQPGKNKVRVEMSKNTLPYTLTWSYRTLKPANPEGCPVHLTTRLDVTKATEGETVRLTATVKNQSGKGQGMAVAILGLPGGLIVPEDHKQLKELIRLPEDGSRPKVSAYEIRGRELVLYWRDLAPAQEITVNLDLVCRVPGEYRGPASRAYLYYNADRKFWTEPLEAVIAPKAD